MNSCSELSIGMSLTGSASRQACFVVVDCPKPWTSKIQASPHFPTAARAALDSAMERGFSFGLLGRVSADSPRLTVYRLFEHGPEQDTMVLDDPHLEQRLIQSLEGAGHYQPVEPALFVCTHGTRDRCCGTLGVPLLLAARSIERRNVWEVSHLGGHRFAPTCLALPEWRTFGRVQPADAEALLASLDQADAEQCRWLRGHNALSPVAQVLERAWAEEFGRVPEMSLDGPESGLIHCRFEGIWQERAGEVTSLEFIGAASCADLEKAPRSATTYAFARWSSPARPVVGVRTG
jgi:hypothetical protein